MSKIIHILQSLPSPTKYHFKELEKIAIDFIFIIEVLCRSPEKGGLGLFNLTEFEFAIYEKVDRLIWTGEKYHKIFKSILG